MASEFDTCESAHKVRESLGQLPPSQQHQVVSAWLTQNLGPGNARLRFCGECQAWEMGIPDLDVPDPQTIYSCSRTPCPSQICVSCFQRLHPPMPSVDPIIAIGDYVCRRHPM